MMTIKRMLKQHLAIVVLLVLAGTSAAPPATAETVAEALEACVAPIRATESSEETCEGALIHCIIGSPSEQMSPELSLVPECPNLPFEPPECDEEDREYRTGHVGCFFSCGGSDRLDIEVTSGDTLDHIWGDAVCGGAEASCTEFGSDRCQDVSRTLTERATEYGECDGHGFDPTYHGRYTLAAKCSSCWVQGGACDETTNVAMQATIENGQVIDAIGVVSSGGVTMSFVPTVLISETVDGILIALSA